MSRHNPRTCNTPDCITCEGIAEEQLYEGDLFTVSAQEADDEADREAGW